MPAAPGTILPVGRVVAALASLAGAAQLAVGSAPPIHAVAVRDGSGATRMLVANLGTEHRRVTVRVGSETARPYEAAVLRDDGAGGPSWVSTEVAEGALELPPAGAASLLIPDGPVGRAPEADGDR
jgi:hypothetical protein